MREQDEECHLGDSVYAHLDNYGTIWLGAKRAGVQQWVALEPQTLRQFERWVRQLHDARESKDDQPAP